MTTIPDKYLIPKHLKKTTKYTEEDRNLVKELHKNGTKIREIARILPMSRRMIQFILFPERALLAKKNFALRQKDGRYRYPTAVQSKMVQAVRKRKKKILKYLIKK